MMRIESAPTLCHCGAVWLFATAHFDAEGARHTPTACFEAS